MNCEFQGECFVIILHILVNTNRIRAIKYETRIDKFNLSAMNGEQNLDIKSAIAITNRMIAISLELNFKSDKINGVRIAKLISAKMEIAMPIIIFK